MSFALLAAFQVVVGRLNLFFSEEKKLFKDQVKIFFLHNYINGIMCVSRQVDGGDHPPDKCVKLHKDQGVKSSFCCVWFL